MTRIRSDGGIVGVLNNPTAGSAQGIWSVKEMERAIRGSIWPIYTEVFDTDQYFNYVSPLLHGNGTVGANNTVFINSANGTMAAAITVGKPAQGSFSPYSQTGWSAYFDGTGDYITFANNTPGFQMGANNFTIEFWLNPVGTTAPQRVINNWGSATATEASWRIDVNTSGTGISFVGSTAGASAQVTCSGTVTKNIWQHIAAVRNGNVFSLYVDGVLQQSNTQAITLQGPATAITAIGSRYSAGSFIEPFNGYLSDLRVIKNVAVYTGAFSPPTTKLTANSVTSLLTFQDNRFKDQSTDNLRLTRIGNTAIMPFSPLAPTIPYSTSTVGGSTYFDGSGISLTTGPYYFFTQEDSASMVQLGDGDFTVECWTYMMATNSNNHFLIDAQNNSQATSWRLFFNTSNNIFTWQVGTSLPISSNAFLTPTTTNEWNHVAVTRFGTSLKIWVNGNLSNTATNSTNHAPTTNLHIGSAGTTFVNRLNGYITDARIIKGAAAYAETFTPPTTPLTANSITTFLGRETNAGIIDNAAKINYITYGTANISSTQSKFGGTSMGFNGSTAALYAPNNAITTTLNTINASENFTVECWVNTPTGSLAPAIWQNAISAKILAFLLTDATPAVLYSIVGGPNYNSSGNSLVVRATTNIQTNTWTHVAFVRSGSTITIYINGTAAGTATNSLGTLSLQVIGAIAQTGVPNFYFFNGYIDDLRITKGIARYTSNFTPSSIAFFDR